VHKIAISPEAIAGVMRRRGRLHMFDELDPARCALIVVDMQNAFLAAGLSPLEVPAAREIVPNVNRLAAAIREAGGTVVWVQNTVDDDGSWSVYLDRFMTPERRAAVVRTLARGGEGYALYPELSPDPADQIVEKTRYSAFLPGASNLDALLRARGIDTVVITGTLTNVCCESSARDAMMLNYNVVFVSDATATLTDEAHNATLGTLMQICADVMSADEVIARLGTAQAEERVLSR
jgi:ureidoacrylate peracid hydrolase